MDDGMSGGQSKPGGVLRHVVAGVLMLVCAAPYAGELPDPTRMPAFIAAPVASGSVEAAPVGLQSIIISPKRRAAIIDGQTVELGGKHGDARLIEVNESSVVLSGSQGRQVLALFPDVVMTGRKPVRAAGKASSAGKKSGAVAGKEKK